jgi:hypothetical protein
VIVYAGGYEAEEQSGYQRALKVDAAHAKEEGKAFGTKHSGGGHVEQEEKAFGKTQSGGDHMEGRRTTARRGDGLRASTSVGS